MPFNNVPITSANEIVPCPVCRFPVRLHWRGGYLDSYVPERDQSVWEKPDIVVKRDPRAERLLRRERNGKKTVALVGFAPASCGLAPYDEKEVEIWGLNQAHAFPWMKRWDRWFQLHKHSSYTRQLSLKRGVVGHYDWLQMKHDKPIYMLFRQPEIPDSVEYPLEDACKYLSKCYKGLNVAKYFTSTLAYMIPIALMEDFQRIEIYGFEMAAEDEFAPQKACAEFWIGIALGLGKEIYLPEDNSLLRGPLYGYEGVGPENKI